MRNGDALTHARAQGRAFAVKVVPVGDDFGDIIKEIKVMRQCHSPHIVKYYGKLFHEEQLWVGRGGRGRGSG